MRWRGFSALVAVGAVVATIGVGSAAAATTWTVDQTTGNDILCPATHVCRTIQRAVNLAAPGDTINVHRGQYNENVTIDKSLKLNGQTRAALVNNCNATTLANPAQDTIVNGGGGGWAVDIEADNVSVRGFVLRNANFGGVVDTTATGRWSGFTFAQNLFEANSLGIAESSNGAFPNLVQQNCFRLNANAGMLGGGSQNKNVRVVGNKSTKNPRYSYQMVANTTDGLDLSGNIATSDGVFLTLLRTTNFTVQGNIANSLVTGLPEQAGMYFGGNSNGTIGGNILQKGNKRGIVFDNAFFGTPANTNLTITGNIVQSFAGNGMEATPGALKNSTITGNVTNVTGVNGLLLAGGNTGNSFAGNIFQGKTWGCHVLGSSVALNNWNGSSNIGTPMNTPGTCFP